jgi:rare lipoprotein A
MSLRICPWLSRCCLPAPLLASLLAPLLILSGCGSAPKSAAPDTPAARGASTAKPSTQLPALPRAGSGRGGYYMDDGPGDAPPDGLLDVPDAEPKVEPYTARGNKPYVVFGKSYTPITDGRPFKQRGVGSWYGKKFHGQKTSSGELYDMYKMSAAHPTLPIPSYARVTNLSNGKQVIVRVNDRGPFHSSRIIDLSYTAALKLGYLGKGSSELEVERLLPDEIARINAARREQLVRAEQATPTGDVLAAAAATEPERLEAKPPGQAKSLDNMVEASTVASLVADKPVVIAATSRSTAAAPGFYLQFGAYSQAANAEAARDRLAQGNAGSLPPVEVAEVGVFYRLFSGPFATRAEAASAALRLQDAGAGKPMIVQR